MADQNKTLYEEKGRALKAIALVAVIMTWAQKRALDPVEFVESLTSKEWEMFATLAGNKSFPSDECRSMVKTAIRQAHEIMRAEESRAGA